ncbi:MAG: aldo/keto reductase [Myxococcota bacterium]
MDTAFLGKTGVRVSTLAFGTMSFGGDADEATSADLYAACRDAGINHFDTADMYSRGASETILGKLIAHERDAIVLASKAYFPMGDGPNERGTSRFHLVRAAEASLRRLGTDRIDLYYLHRFDERTDLSETLRAIDDLVRSGKILYPCVSNFAAWQVTKALGIQALLGLSPIAAIQPMYNLIKRQVEVELLPMAESEGLGVFPYSPLGGGVLSGKYGRGESGRLRENEVYKERYAGNEETAAAFATIADELGVHPVTLAVAWVKSHPGVTAPLLGARSVKQLRPALEAANFAMDDALRARLSALTPEPAPATDRREEKGGGGFGGR